MGIPRTDEIVKNVFCQEKNGLPGISLVSTILALEMKQYGQAFFGILAVPLGKDYVHYVVCCRNPLKVKVNSERV